MATVGHLLNHSQVGGRGVQGKKCQMAYLSHRPAPPCPLPLFLHKEVMTHRLRMYRLSMHTWTSIRLSCTIQLCVTTYDEHTSLDFIGFLKNTPNHNCMQVCTYSHVQEVTWFKVNATCAHNIESKLWSWIHNSKLTKSSFNSPIHGQPRSWFWQRITSRDISRRMTLSGKHCVWTKWKKNSGSKSLVTP